MKYKTILFLAFGCLFAVGIAGAETKAKDVRTRPVIKKRVVHKPTVYVTDWCGYCKRLESYLDGQKIKYKRINIETFEGRRKYDKLGVRGVPMTVIDGKVIKGYQPERIKAAALGE